MNGFHYGFRDDFAGIRAQIWLDGLDGQEDELEDVKKGKLDPPTNDEGEGEVFIKPDQDAVALKKEDEDNELVEKYPGA
jgi:hypothetical protein